MSNSLSPNHTIQANRSKVMLLFLFSIGIQLACFTYIAYSDFITYSFIFAAIFLILFFILMLIFSYSLIKFGRPKLIFEEQQCKIHVLSLHIEIKYAQISSLNLNKIEQLSSGFNHVPKIYQLTLYLYAKTAQYHLITKETRDINSFLLTSHQLFSNEQILQASIIFCVLCRSHTDKRRQLLEKLTCTSSGAYALVSSKELEKFKNNLYLSKSFNSGQ